VTDVTGFGLVGHLHQLARASGCAATLRASALPLLPGAAELVTAGYAPGGSRRNRAAAAAYTVIAEGVAEVAAALAHDAQTSGGLLAALDPAAAGRLGLGTVVGRLEVGQPGAVRLDP
jgi:selenide,water dikinase